MEPDYNKFQKVCEELRRGTPLNLKMIAEVFGSEFWELFVLCMTNIEIKHDGKVEIHIHEK